MAFLIDSFIVFIADKIIEQARQEIVTNEEDIKRNLRELYEQLESGKITELEFETKEADLVNKLEQIEERKKEIDQAA